MSTKYKVLIWFTTLFIGTSFWGYLTAKIYFDSGENLATLIGIGLGSSLPVLFITGIISGIIYYFFKYWKTAMWTWTVLVLIAMLWLTLGHSFIINNV